MSNLLIVVLLIVLFGGALGTAPRWQHSANLGWGPSGGLGTIAVILFFLWLFGVI